MGYQSCGRVLDGATTLYVTLLTCTSRPCLQNKSLRLIRAYTILNFSIKYESGVYPEVEPDFYPGFSNFSSKAVLVSGRLHLTTKANLDSQAWHAAVELICADPVDSPLEMYARRLTWHTVSDWVAIGIGANQLKSSMSLPRL